YKELKPYVNFIPVAEDLSDIITQIEWAKNHDAECQKIAENAYRTAEEVLRLECSYLYLYRLLEAYSKKQQKYY
ncbi:MAG: glycosyl transferase family 90, partial [Rhabdochlamydiaceae bacterium]